MTYRIVITPAGLKLLETVPDRRIREQIRDRIDGLAHEPEQQGKPLKGDLAGFRSLRAVGQRYRILYRVERARVLVVVVAVGLRIVAVGLRKEGDRHDIYRLAQKLIRLHLI
ncbi:MAG: type II toxin-antitoxin system RelE/ParE family toxin [Candidatus Omnitrophica bacterium]|nr:type II toxin-antitoxin system RelE/ParE family toxin [Candidatus Omnitrophota bacterium]